MFKRQVKNVGEVLMQNLRILGLETPLLQKRLIESWPTVAGDAIARYTTDVSIYNQTLYVKLSMPALRADLSMRRQDFVRLLNEHVGSQVIADIRFL
jgi:predicted nucleic acid-binding Zn ribbon protein